MCYIYVGDIYMKKKNIIVCLVLLVIAALYTIAVKTIDVDTYVVGGNDIKIGFASINKGIVDFIGENNTFYKISEVLGYLCLGLVGIYGIVGLYQLIKRKSLFKVDKEILGLGGFYIVVLGVYFLFDKIVINYRPVLEDGELAASFPSSHTVLAICVCVSAIWINRKLFKSDMTKIANYLLALLLFLTVLFRFISGVHWFTDIVGGVIYSCALLMIFKSVLDLLEKKN